jgi:prophage regulatory protein
MRIIDWKQMKEMHLNPYSRQHTKRLEDAGLYPKRVRIGNNRVGWVLDEILKHNQKLAEQRYTTDTPA